MGTKADASANRTAADLGVAAAIAEAFDALGAAQSWLALASTSSVDAHEAEIRLGRLAKAEQSLLRAISAIGVADGYAGRICREMSRDELISNSLPSEGSVRQ